MPRLQSFGIQTRRNSKSMCLLDTATSRISNRSGTIPVSPAVISLDMNTAMDAARRNACICISNTLVLEFPRWVSFFRFPFFTATWDRGVEHHTRRTASLELSVVVWLLSLPCLSY